MTWGGGLRGGRVGWRRGWRCVRVSVFDDDAGAQIDPVLCTFTTVSLYGLLQAFAVWAGVAVVLRWRAVAGAGVVTKGVGFLPLLPV